MTDLDSRQRDRGPHSGRGRVEGARRDYRNHPGYRGYGAEREPLAPYRGFGAQTGPAPADYPDYADYYPDYAEDDGDYADYDEYADYPDDGGRWRPVAITAGLVLAAALVATAVILQSGGNGGTAGTVSSPPTRTVIATPPPAPAPTGSLPPETITTVTPTTPTTTAAPSTTSAPPPPPPTSTTAPAEQRRVITYTVTGTKSLLDLVTVVYTDEQGFPRTDLNVALPWSRRVVLNPGVNITSVTATSVHSQLNCAITDGTGQLLRQTATNSMIATCTR
ncbi:hypothetical protein [Mycobacterium sp. 1274756.6]|uniref:hypothetical protein n=1 Tax=Mycobacterium sp. 1274756.6 TaxID=1834076 RepID=UPI0009EE2277|nr:hypothetical protein [Mycobacterium sp. 1274756.6]